MQTLSFKSRTDLLNIPSEDPSINKATQAFEAVKNTQREPAIGYRSIRAELASAHSYLIPQLENLIAEKISGSMENLQDITDVLKAITLLTDFYYGIEFNFSNQHISETNQLILITKARIYYEKYLHPQTVEGASFQNTRGTAFDLNEVRAIVLQLASLRGLITEI